MIDPLTQFMIHPLIPLEWLGYDISFTNASLFMMLAVCCSCLILLRAAYARDLVPSRGQYIGQAIYTFAESMLVEATGPAGKPYTPLIMSLFLFVLLGNLLGMIPYGFTFTSHIVVTFALASVVFISITIFGFIKHKARFLRIFYPAGTPLYIAPLLLPVEIMSYFIRPISLSIRLFANMVAGHAMLKIFASFVVMLGTTSFFPIAILPFFLNVAIIGFELFVAALQAYVFTILTCIYLNDAINLN